MPRSCGRPNSLALALILWNLCLASLPASAETVLSGKAEQGGLMMGRTVPGAHVSLDGRAVSLSPDGLFLLGFGRNAGPSALLEIDAGHKREARRIEVARRDWPVQRVEGLPREKAAPDPAAVARIKAENDMVREIRGRSTPWPDFLSGLIRPAAGVVSGVFGSQRFYNGNAGAPHSGLDIAGPKGTAVVAAADGVVVLAAPDLFLTGQTVMIDHGLGLISSYAHLSAISVQVGDRLRKGQPIGAIGASGLTTGAHLHWGVSWQEVRLDPESVEELLRKP